MSNGPKTAGWCVTLEFDLSDADPASFDAFEQALSDPCLEQDSSFALSREEAAGIWRIRAVLPLRPGDGWLYPRLTVAADKSGHVPRAVTVEPLPETDWVAAVNRGHPAVWAGPFYVRGNHIQAPAPAGHHDILLDAGRAFGTGSHETTRGCLLAIAASLRPGADTRALDLGTGSGLLAIAMARHWGVRVIASDNDPVAVAVAAENAAVNGVGAAVLTCLSRSFASPFLRTAGPFGFIAANILAQPLIRMAPALARNLQSDGRAVLSGILAGQEFAVRRAYARQGLVVCDRIVLGEWPTLVVARC